MLTRHDTSALTPRRSSLKHRTPATHDYAGQGVGLYDGALLLAEAAHIAVGDYALVGSRGRPGRYRVRHIAYHPGYPAYWRVQIEHVAGPPVLERAAPTARRRVV